MIDKIITACFHRRHIAWGAAILIGFYGYISGTQMMVEAYPELDDVSVSVTTQVPGLAAEEIEQQITIPLERALVSVPNISVLRSSSTFALSLITMVFKDGTDEYFPRERVQEVLSQTSLPPGIFPSLDPLVGSSSEIYRYTLTSNTKTLMELSEIQRWLIIPKLKQAPGISDVVNFGG